MKKNEKQMPVKTIKTNAVISRVDFVREETQTHFVIDFETKIGTFRFLSNPISIETNNIVSVNAPGVEEFLKFMYIFNKNSISELLGMAVVIEYEEMSLKLVSVSHFIDEKISILFQKLLDTIEA